MRKIESKNKLEHPKGVQIPEKVLLIEILKRAINDLLGHFGDAQKYKGKNPLYLDAKRWIFKPINQYYQEPFSFAWVCYHLEQDPKEVRKRIMCLKSQLDKTPLHASMPLSTPRVDIYDYLV